MKHTHENQNMIHWNVCFNKLSRVFRVFYSNLSKVNVCLLNVRLELIVISALQLCTLYLLNHSMQLIKFLCNTKTKLFHMQKVLVQVRAYKLDSCSTCDYTQI